MASGGSQPSKTTQVSQVRLPGWVNTAGKENYRLAKRVAEKPLKQWEGDRIADPSQMTLQGYGLLEKNLGSLDPYFDKAGKAYDASSAMYNKGAGVLDQASPLYGRANAEFAKASGMVDAAKPLYGEAADIYRSTAGPLDISPYLNPYTGEVEQRSIANANTALTQQLAQQKADAAKANVFGGSRFGVQQGVTASEGARGIGDLTAALRKAGIDYATTTGLQDRAGIRDSAAGLLGTASGRLGAAGTYGNVGTGYLNTAAGMRDTAAGYGSLAGGLGATGQGYLSTAGAKGAQNATDVASFLGAGAQQEGQKQKEINSLIDLFNERRNYPVEQLNIRLAALGMTPYGKTETSTKTGTSEQPGPDWATLGLGALKTIPAFWAMSDKSMKTDIEKLTDGPIPLYAYRYKSDPKSYPKVIGPMAQDVEKVVPSAVKKVRGKRVVNISNLLEVLS